MLLRLRQDYVEELPARIAALEVPLLAAGSGGDPGGERFADLYRQVHGLLGSGGSHGLHIVSSICHQLEDYINRAAGNPPRLAPAHVAPALRHVDLLREAAGQAAAGEERFEAVECALARLREELFPQTLSALVVLASRATAQQCQRPLDAAGFRAVLMDDSCAALRRALTESFDVLITSPELPVLSGTGLLAAVRLSGAPGQGPRSVLITASGGMARSQRRVIDPDFVIARDGDLAANLERALATVRAARPSAA